jgi:hypothetical protein
MNQNLTTEQINDIKERTQKVIDLIQTLELEIQAQVIAMDTGDNIFGIKVVPFLKDLKFIPKTTSEVSGTDIPKITDVESTPTISPFVPQANTDENPN